jgi:hypothetical protein
MDTENMKGLLYFLTGIIIAILQFFAVAPLPLAHPCKTSTKDVLGVDQTHVCFPLVLRGREQPNHATARNLGPL